MLNDILSWWYSVYADLKRDMGILGALMPFIWLGMAIASIIRYF